jgi:hypothetical protein
MKDWWRRRDKHEQQEVAKNERNCKVHRSFSLGIERISEPWAASAEIFGDSLVDLHT